MRAERDTSILTEHTRTWRKRRDILTYLDTVDDHNYLDTREFHEYAARIEGVIHLAAASEQRAAEVSGKQRAASSSSDRSPLTAHSSLPNGSPLTAHRSPFRGLTTRQIHERLGCSIDCPQHDIRRRRSNKFSYDSSDSEPGTRNPKPACMARPEWTLDAITSLKSVELVEALVDRFRPSRGSTKYEHKWRGRNGMRWLFGTTRRDLPPYADTGVENPASL